MVTWFNIPGLCGKELTLYQTKKFSGSSKFKAIADDKINMTQKVIFFSVQEQNIMGKCWLPAFSPFTTMFSKGLFV